MKKIKSYKNLIIKYKREGKPMKKQLISIAMLCTIFAGGAVSAADDLDDVTMEISTKEVKRGHRINFQMKEVIQEYMLEKGDITQEEIDAHKAERTANREALQALKEAGDTEGYEALRAEFKASRDERKASMKEYIDGNEELKTAIDEKKATMKEERKRRREERRQNKENTES